MNIIFIILGIVLLFIVFKFFLKMISRLFKIGIVAVILICGYYFFLKNENNYQIKNFSVENILNK